MLYIKTIFSRCHSTKSGPARGIAYDPSGLDPAAVKPGLFFFFFLPLLQSEFLPFFSNVMIITEHPANSHLSSGWGRGSQSSVQQSWNAPESTELSS